MNDNMLKNALTIDSLWQFSLSVYAKKEIQEACLTLQNHFQGNVNLLLTLHWLDQHKLSFSHQEWQRIRQSLQRTEALLQQFRQLRRKTKHHLSDELYQETLQFELQLERQQQTDIVDAIHQITLIKVEVPHLTHDYCQQLSAEHISNILSK